MPGSPGGEGLDSAFEALSNRYRRRLLAALLDHNPESGLDPQAPFESGSVAEDVEAASVTIRHLHLPMLEDEGYVEWDRTAGTVSKGPHWRELEPLLECLEAEMDGVAEA